MGCEGSGSSLAGVYNAVTWGRHKGLLRDAGVVDFRPAECIHVQLIVRNADQVKGALAAAALWWAGCQQRRIAGSWAGLLAPGIVDAPKMCTIQTRPRSHCGYCMSAGITVCLLPRVGCGCLVLVSVSCLSIAIAIMACSLFY